MTRYITALLLMTIAQAGCSLTFYGVKEIKELPPAVLASLRPCPATPAAVQMAKTATPSKL